MIQLFLDRRRAASPNDPLSDSRRGPGHQAGEADQKPLRCSRAEAPGPLERTIRWTAAGRLHVVTRPQGARAHGRPASSVCSRQVDPSATALHAPRACCCCQIQAPRSAPAPRTSSVEPARIEAASPNPGWFLRSAGIRTAPGTGPAASRPARPRLLAGSPRRWAGRPGVQDQATSERSTPMPKSAVATSTRPGVLLKCSQGPASALPDPYGVISDGRHPSSRRVARGQASTNAACARRSSTPPWRRPPPQARRSGSAGLPGAWRAGLWRAGRAHLIRGRRKTAAGGLMSAAPRGRRWRFRGTAARQGSGAAQLPQPAGTRAGSQWAPGADASGPHPGLSHQAALPSSTSFQQPAGWPRRRSAPGSDVPRAIGLVCAVQAGWRRGRVEAGRAGQAAGIPGRLAPKTGLTCSCISAHQGERSQQPAPWRTRAGNWKQSDLATAVGSHRQRSHGGQAGSSDHPAGCPAESHSAELALEDALDGAVQDRSRVDPVPNPTPDLVCWPL